MTVWRMAMRCGSGGYDMSQECIKRGVAAITYGPLEELDLSAFPEGEPQERWAKLAPAQQASLRRIVHEVKKCDTIYVKRGRAIVGRGIVLGAYRFDHTLNLRDPNGTPWSHQVSVSWEADFVPVEVLLGSALPELLHRVPQSRSTVVTSQGAEDATGRATCCVTTWWGWAFWLLLHGKIALRHTTFLG